MLISLEESYQNDSPKVKEESKDVQFIKTKSVEEVTPVNIKNISEVPISEVKTNSNNIMPDLRNYSLREALVILTRLGLKYKVSGSGKISSQSILPGSQIKKGAICKINCNEIKNELLIN